MYKCYYVLKLCLFLQNLGDRLRLLLQFQNLFGSSGHNFYPLDNEATKSPEIVISYFYIKQECFSQYWFRNAYSTVLVL